MYDLRIAQKGDIENVIGFYHSVIKSLGENNLPKWKIGVYPTDEYIISAIEKGELYALFDNQKIIGATVLNSCVNDGYQKVNWKVNAKSVENLNIHILRVSAKYQGQGIGKTLLSKVIEIAKKKNKKVLRLDALKENYIAKNLYESAGFAFIQDVKLYYEDTGWTDYSIFEYAL